jgi:hypothetical protein
MFDGQPRRGNVNADAGTDTGQARYRQGIVDFGRLRIVDREGAHVGARQILGQAGRFKRREIRALWKLLMQESGGNAGGKPT